jgi:hypothetical protein
MYVLKYTHLFKKKNRMFNLISLQHLIAGCYELSGSREGKEFLWLKIFHTLKDYKVAFLGRDKRGSRPGFRASRGRARTTKYDY